MKKNLILIALFCVYQISAQAQNQNTFNDGYKISPHIPKRFLKHQNTFNISIQNILYEQVINTGFDSGYLVAGNTYYYGAGYEDVQLVKLNKYGDTLWTKVYGTKGGDIFSMVVPTNDNGYLVAAYYNNYIPEFIKLDSLGNQQWFKMPSVTAPENYTAVSQGIHGYIVAFQKGDYVNGFKNILLELDKNGNKIWHNESYLNGLSQNVKSVLQDADGYIYTVAQLLPDDLGYSSFVLNKYDSNGNFIWDRIIDPVVTGYGAFGNYLLKTVQNHILIVGSFREKSTYTNHYTVLSLDTAGNIIRSDSLPPNVIVLAKYLRGLKDKPVNFNLYGTSANVDFDQTLALASDGGIIEITGTNVYKRTSTGKVCPDLMPGPPLSYGHIDYHTFSYPNINVAENLNNPDSLLFKTAGAVVTKYCSSGLNADAIAFQAFKNKDSNILNWSADNETGNDKYIIERSSDNNNFRPIGTVSANSNVNGFYSFKDEHSLNGNNYYRLQIKADNSENLYSDSRMVRNSAHISIYPNPVKNILSIDGINAGNTTRLVIMNMKGSIVNKTDLKNYKTYNWNIGNLAAGTYLLKIQNENSIETIAFMKQ